MNRLTVQLPGQTLASLRHVRAHRFSTITLDKRQSVQKRQRSTDNGRKDDQVIPLTGYYADILNASASRKSSDGDVLDQPLEQIQPVTHTPPAPPPPPTDSSPKNEKEERVEKARIIFGSRLAGPGERREKIDAASSVIAGVTVPPKPTEPDNCCMSGCVNCVWDMYRDDMEEWAAKSTEARAKLQAQRTSGAATGTMNQVPGMPSHVAVSMDDDGGGSETNWTGGVGTSGESDDLFEGIPVGIRAFMRTEKMLKEKHAREKGLRS